MIALKRKLKLPDDMCAVMRCRRKTNLQCVVHPDKGSIFICEPHQQESGWEKPELLPFLEEESDPGEEEEEETTTALATTTTEAQLQAEATDASEALNYIQDMEIESLDDVEFAANALSEAKGHWKRLEEMKRKVTKPMNDALREVRDWFGPPQKFYKECEATIKGKLGKYHEEQAENRRSALAEASKATQGAGDVRAALVKLEQSEEPEISGLSYRSKWDFEVVDLDKVPASFLQINEKALRAFASQMQDKAEVPGIRFFIRTIVASGSKGT